MILCRIRRFDGDGSKVLSDGHRSSEDAVQTARKLDPTINHERLAGHWNARNAIGVKYTIEVYDRPNMEGA